MGRDKLVFLLISLCASMSVYIVYDKQIRKDSVINSSKISRLAAETYPERRLCMMTNVDQRPAEWTRHNIHICKFNLAEIMDGLVDMDEFVNEFYPSDCVGMLDKVRLTTISDASRYALLYKYGGIYFDSDTLCLKPVPEKFTNFISKPAKTHFSNGILKFQKSHAMMASAVKRMPAQLKVCGTREKHQFTCVGPVFLSLSLINRTSGNFEYLYEPLSKQLHVIPVKQVYPNWGQKLDHPFMAKSYATVLNTIKDSYFLHLYNHFLNKEYKTGSNILKYPDFNGSMVKF